MNKKIIVTVVGLLALILIAAFVYPSISNRAVAPTDSENEQQAGTTSPTHDPEAYQQYAHEAGFVFEYPKNWELAPGEATLPIINRVDVIESTPPNQEPDGDRSDIAVIMTSEDPNAIKNRIRSEFGGTSEGMKQFPSHSGELFLATRQATSHASRATDSQLEYVTTINGETYWIRLFSSPEKIETDREILTHLLSTFRVEK